MHLRGIEDNTTTVFILKTQSPSHDRCLQWTHSSESTAYISNPQQINNKYNIN